MVFINLEMEINNLRTKLLNDPSLDSIFYFYLQNEQKKINSLNIDIIGEANSAAYNFYKGIYTDISTLEKIAKKMEAEDYRLSINIFCLLGLFLQEPSLFKKFVEYTFENNSIRFKFIISKVAPLDFEEKFIYQIKNLQIKDNPFFLLLKRIYLNSEENNFSHLLLGEQSDIIDLIALEDYQKIKNLQYSKQQEALTEDLFKMAHHIQTKYKILNNSEDQFNSMFQSLLEFSEYTALDQTMRGASLNSNSKSPGELDLLISKNGYILSIFEAFKIDSIDSEYIKNHLIKLSKNYDPNGLRINYAVIYAKNNNFIDLWQRYQTFIKTINFEFPLINSEVKDISDKYPHFTDIRLCLTEHLRSEQIIKVFHIFMNMNHT
jgi:hypothetical protein